MADVKLRTVRHPSDTKPPTHIVATAGANYRLCGHRDLYPVVLARHAGRENYDCLYCAECVAAL